MSQLIVLVPFTVLLSALILSRVSKPITVLNAGRLLLGFAILGASASLVYGLNPSAQKEMPVLGDFGTLFIIDRLSTLMFIMVSVIGLIILQFSKNYLDGDARHAHFLRSLLVTIGLVQIFMLAGTLPVLIFTWIATSFSLQQLIFFYKDRKEAARAMRKKFVVARFSDLALVMAAWLLYQEVGSADLSHIFDYLTLKSQSALNLELAAMFLVLAAAIKSVQIPFHGWVLDVMEAPTPVSGLLHAGLLNAGPFLIIRFAYLMDVVTFAPILLIIIGGLSALYGTLVFPTQPAVKTSLAYSSIGHMGFSLMICGLGLYAAALLHLIAHSFYKAHAFLSSGSGIDKKRLQLLRGNEQINTTFLQALIGLILSTLLYLIFANYVATAEQFNFQMYVLGIIILLGLASFLTKTIRLQNGFSVIIISLSIAAFVLLSFFSFEHLMSQYLIAQIPAIKMANIGVQIASVILVISYMLIVLIQSLQQPTKKQFTHSKWQLYKRNGFYVHTIFDGVIKKLYPKNA